MENPDITFAEMLETAEEFQHMGHTFYDYKFSDSIGCVMKIQDRKSGKGFYQSYEGRVYKTREDAAEFLFGREV